jgi:hypothetical protein
MLMITITENRFFRAAGWNKHMAIMINIVEIEETIGVSMVEISLCIIRKKMMDVLRINI